RVRLVEDYRVSYEAMPQVLRREHLFEVFGPLTRGLATESVFVAALTSSQKVVAVVEVSKGGVSQSPVVLAEIFRAVLAAGCANFAICHNHPSGEGQPSPQDRELTKAVSQAANLLSFRFLDHVIMPEGGEPFSFREAGLL